MKNKLIRITTVPISLDKLLSGQLAYMNQFYKVIAVSSEKKYLEKVGEKENVEVFNIEMTRQITPVKDLISVYKLYLFFKKQKPFIVHTHTPKAGTVGMLAAKLAGVPNRLHTIAGLPLLEATGNKRKLLNFVEKITYRCATKVYPNSFGLNEIIIQEKFCNPDKLKVLGNGSTNGIDTSFFNAKKYSQIENDALKKTLEILPNDFVFIFVGRLVSDKGINELTEAFKKLNGLFSNTKLLLVGPSETELDPLLPKALKEIEENKSIISVGYQNDVRSYFAISNALVFPSYREGFPNVVMQAGAMGLPSIVSNINGCNEIIIENHNGIIIPVKNTIAIFDAMKKMVENVAFYNQLKENSRKRIVDNYEQEVVWNAILNEYKKLEENV
ncbi:glycosyltransferase family 4 protein [uncultured Flavobacterium sp.]|uniref:glycosyltransferase family 4 protein n=1 Tax=uncultured Flavobacterium sp. TaxID=165435 RepID=UPI0030EEB493|tara:strand:- start:60945 stop:62102 length:1158 start_codon:yes stop_codon:yes gene_type:complete